MIGADVIFSLHISGSDSGGLSQRGTSPQPLCYNFWAMPVAEAIANFLMSVGNML